MNENIKDIIIKQINNCIHETDFSKYKKYKGKVRDVYDLDDKLLIIATDRISAFDKVLGVIPFKGEILTNLSLFWFEKTKDIIQNHIIKQIHPNAILVKKCRIIPIEVIIRGYLTGGGWREYSKTGEISGIKLKPNLKKDSKFEKPIFTPTTKAAQGHDESISREEIINRKIISKELLDKIEDISIRLYSRGNQIAGKNNLILVDTKYEFGLTDNGSLVLADEIHTPDSSRFWYLDSYKNLYENGSEQKMLDKEYLRQWLLSNKYKGDGEPPKLPLEVITEVCIKYLSAFETITGEHYQLTNKDGFSALNKAVTENIF
jgi:phosphoribosylaminoimidazole-succinocarboxamide synthase